MPFKWGIHLHQRSRSLSQKTLGYKISLDCGEDWSLLSELIQGRFGFLM